MRKLVETGVAMAVMVTLIGCGDDPPAEPIDELARYLPSADPGLIAFADLAEAREQLGLPADAEPLRFELLADEDYDPNGPEAELLDIARLTLAILGASSETLKPLPVTDAFDGGAISAAASGGGADVLTAIKTSQPFDELAEALVGLGYEREGDLLSKPGATVSEVGYAGDGIVVIAARGGSAADAIADPPGGPAPATALLEGADEPLRLASAGFDATCVTGYGGWQDPTGETGVLRIAVDGTADTDLVDLQGFARYTGAELGEPSADGEYIDVPFSGAGQGGDSPVRDFQVSLGEDLYECD